MEGPLAVLQQDNERLADRIQEAEAELDEALKSVRYWWEKWAASKSRAEAAEEERDRLRGLVREARDLAGKSWSRGMNFNVPPSPREWRAWMDKHDALIAEAEDAGGRE